MPNRTLIPGRTKTGRALAIALAAAAAAGTAAGDDRELLRDSVGKPYVFILLDTSGSMNWTPRCTQAEFDAGQCTPLCPSGDCYAPRQADDPGSKFYQAKQALYEVLKGVDDIQFGFATYNQDALGARAKHWLYAAVNDGVTVPGWGTFPAAGGQDVFGLLWNCDTGVGDHEIGCNAGTPADLSDPWEASRMQRLPKGGLSFGQNVDFFIRHAGATYRVRYQPATGTYGANLQVNVQIWRCNNASCTNVTSIGAQTVAFRPLGEFLSWDVGGGNNLARTNPQLSYFSQAAAADPTAANTCAGWDANTDSLADRFANTYSVRWPTDTTDPRGALFHLGDVIPLDWTAAHREDILRRLAPNTALDATATPDFSVATYFADNRQGGENFLRLENEAARPFLASGATPLGNSIRAFRTWYAGCGQGTCPNGGGWSGIAATQDPDWSCRRKFLLVLTDGDDTCGGADACAGTAALFAQEGIKTYVVAFGVENTAGNRLTCMAANGGSGDPIYPQNKDELVSALARILGQIREEASAFASAAVPSVQAEVADRIYLSSFTPLDAHSVWDGHLDAYLKPLPLTPDAKPDRGRACGAPPRSGCHLWDAGEVILSQAPTASDLSTSPVLNESVLRLGLGPDERRVFYTQAGASGALPRRLRLFSPPPGDPKTDPQWSDLWRGLGLPDPATDPEYAATKKRVEAIVARTLVIKEATIERNNVPTDIRFLLGDIFHSDPLVADRPNDFSFFAANLYGNPAAVNCVNDPGYRCFAEKHRRRRKMLVVGSNDGQLHFFDAGVWNPVEKRFSDGTGRELFSYIPRLQLPVLRELAEQNRQIFAVDATPRLDDVFIDPQHNGVPTADEREWRTIVIGGFREGGRRDGGGFLPDFLSGYYALDFTQPDVLDPGNEPASQQVVPSCLSAQNQSVPGCGSLPFPAVLWEFTDSLASSRLDEDQNGYPDLGETWSAPTIGRIRVLEAGSPADKFVAIFGGGMDAASKPSPKRGTWLYMVDIETGQVIYKRPLVGAAPSDPAVLDADLDGYLDTVYIGTTEGLLYKVDISSPGHLLPILLSRQLALPPLAADAQVLRITDASWSPFPIFDTQARPIYLAPTLFFVGPLSRFAVAFGTGDRENLWSFDGQEGRFFVIVDDNFTLAQFGAGGLPRTELAYQEVRADAADVNPISDFVLSPAGGKERGWFLRLAADERVITQAFGLSGIVIFSSYQPALNVNAPPPGGGRDPSAAVCARGGESNIFVVYANNANSIMSINGLPARFRPVPEFVTNPYVEQGATRNPASGGANSEQLNLTQQEILKALKRFFPKGTKFANYWISVSGIRSDTGYERYATIPVGIIERNWKEH